MVFAMVYRVSYRFQYTTLTDPFDTLYSTHDEMFIPILYYPFFFVCLHLCIVFGVTDALYFFPSEN